MSKIKWNRNCLPEKEGSYLVTVKWGKGVFSVFICNFKSEKWVAKMNGSEIISWAEYPEPDEWYEFDDPSLPGGFISVSQTGRKPIWIRENSL